MFWQAFSSSSPRSFVNTFRVKVVASKMCPLNPWWDSVFGLTTPYPGTFAGHLLWLSHSVSGAYRPQMENPCTPRNTRKTVIVDYPASRQTLTVAGNSCLTTVAASGGDYHNMLI